MLLSETNQAILCDFELCKPIGTCTIVALQGMGTMRWQAPELLLGGTKTTASDVYAFGMTIYEVSPGRGCGIGILSWTWQVIGRRLPFHELESPGQIVTAVVVNAARPALPSERSSVLLDGMRSIMERSWSQCPERRIAVQEILMLLGALQ